MNSSVKRPTQLDFRTASKLSYAGRSGARVNSTTTMADTPGNDGPHATLSTDAGGGVLEHPKPLTITYPGMQKQIERVFDRLHKSGHSINSSELRTFLEGQGERYTDDEGFKAWMKRTLSPTAVDKLLNNKDGIDKAEFTAYLASAANGSIKAIPEDETRPLNEYYISSSHNTYLVGHQLYGASTVDGYRNVLLRGCRSVEIDVWDGEEGEPAVFHGYTLTKEVPFRDVCRAIKENAFVTSELPVIISLEVHASHAQQEKMVSIMKEELGDYLVSERLSQHLDDKALPSPHALRRRLLVKVKHFPIATDPVIAQPTPEAKPNDPDNDASDSSSDEELREAAAAASKTKPKKSKVIQALADLGVYISGHSFKDWEDASKHSDGNISPNQINKATDSGHLMLIRRPFGLVGSSWWLSIGRKLIVTHTLTLSVALRFAGTGGYVLKPPGRRDVNLTGVLAREEKRSVVLRVTILAGQSLPLPEDEAEDEADKLEKLKKKEEKKKRKEAHSRSNSGVKDGDEKSISAIEAGLAAAHVTATALTPPANPESREAESKRDKIKGFFSRMKHRDGADGFEPYIEIQLLADGLDEDGVKGKNKALRGADVVWEGRGLLGSDPPEIVLKASNIVPGASFVRFLLKDEEFGTDDLAGWACVRLDRLQPGYRFIRLYDLHGRLTENGCLFVKIQKEITGTWEII
ncbi:PI-PLC-X domain-containing protein [Rhizoctonia solani AG-1 IA]|uniref:Phosphoinositide phospholipase C n=1 Tax=Thanatephorus cucumeris (strain AG1-IA) TaxID=983506 RepID=L8WPV1_THACA|nr:PI-PLC-X domain-containing protein [Rhizoctonia solani AG-1 IA]